MSKTTLYGIPNCDTMKKAMNWLNKNKVAYSFYDYKKEGITKAKLEEWGNKAGWETFFNKRSTTWKELSTVEQNKVTNLSSAIKVMMNNNSIIKRPIIEHGEKLIIGYNEEAYKKIL